MMKRVEAFDRAMVLVLAMLVATALSQTIGCAPPPDVERQAELIAAIDAHSPGLAELRPCVVEMRQPMERLVCLAAYADQNPLQVVERDDRSTGERLLDGAADIGLGLGSAAADRARRAIEGGGR